jgi:hypothetical protein
MFSGLSLEIKLADLKRPSVLFLLAANILPFVGVLAWGWEVFPILVLFWMENVVVGVFNVLKMLAAKSGNSRGSAAKAAMIPFFCVHYGMFTAVHGVFVFAVFGGDFFGDAPGASTNSVFDTIGNSQLLWGAAALLVSHGASFIVNYLGKGEYKRTSLNELMMQPYGRVIVLHLTIIFGGFLLTIIGSPAAGLVILIVIKLGIDLFAHLAQHRAPGTQTMKASPET